MDKAPGESLHVGLLGHVGSAWAPRGPEAIGGRDVMEARENLLPFVLTKRRSV